MRLKNKSTHGKSKAAVSRAGYSVILKQANGFNGMSKQQLVTKNPFLRQTTY